MSEEQKTVTVLVLHLGDWSRSVRAYTNRFAAEKEQRVRNVLIGKVRGKVDLLPPFDPEDAHQLHQLRGSAPKTVVEAFLKLVDNDPLFRQDPALMLLSSPTSDSPVYALYDVPLVEGDSPG